jgi:hypothetical protein
MGLRNLLEAEAREVCVAKLEHTGTEREEAAVAAHVAELRQSAKESPCRCAGQPRGTRNLAERELRVLGVERSDDREAALQGLHEVSADAAINARGRRSIRVGHADPIE